MHFEIRKAKNGEYFVTQVATNGEVLNTSETMKTNASAVKNIKSVCTGLVANRPVYIKDFAHEIKYLISSGGKHLGKEVLMTPRELQKAKG